MKHIHLGHCVVGMVAVLGLLIASASRQAPSSRSDAVLIRPPVMVFCVGHVFH
jgi:hypothetical protein